MRKTILYTFIVVVFFSYPIGIHSQSDPPVVGDPTEAMHQITNFKVIPASPQTAAFDIYGNVSTSGTTGTPAIVIPLYTLEEDGVSIPISLSYDASGIKVSDISSEVGLKWTLQAGGEISRTIRGLADEDPNNGWFSFHTPTSSNPNINMYPSLSWNNNIDCYQESITRIEENVFDVLPDIYSYTLPAYQGSFFFDTTNVLLKTLQDDLQIKMQNGWTCIDPKGVIYRFGENNIYSRAETESYTHGSAFNPARSGNGISAWKLTSVTTTNGRVINFQYTDYTCEYNATTGEVKRYSTRFNPQITTTTHTTNYSYMNKLIERITTPSVRIEFVYAQENAATEWQRKLTGISIISVNSNELIKRYTFEYDTYQGAQKLRLRSITERGSQSGTSGRVWQFNYESTILPSVNSKDFDYFGYYNAAGNSGLVPYSYNLYNGTYTVVNSRNMNNTAITAGILNEIIYPTGGKTKFYYEANMEVIDGKTHFAPGVRLKKMEDYSDYNNLYNVKEYSYWGLTGNVYQEGDYEHFKKNGVNISPNNTLVLIYSSPKGLLNPKTGFGYREIETCNYSDGVISGKERDYYIFYMAGGLSYYPKIAKKIIYDSTNPLRQKMEYQYQTYGSNTHRLGWNVYSEDVDSRFDYYCDAGTEWTYHYHYGIYEDYLYTTHLAILQSRVTTTDYLATDSVKHSVTYSYNSDLQLISENRGTSQELTEHQRDIQYLPPPSIPGYVKRVWSDYQ